MKNKIDLFNSQYDFTLQYIPNNTITIYTNEGNKKEINNK